MSSTEPKERVGEIEIPEEFEEWIRQWLRENVVTKAVEGEDIDITLDRHNAKTTWAWAIAIAAYRRLSPSPSGWIDEVVNMRDHATKMVNKLKYADDTEDDFSELNFYHGQQVALNQVLEFIKHSFPNLPPPPDSKDL